MKRVGYILGRRIKGDIIMDTDPFTNAPGRLLGPAVRLTNTDQFYDEASDVQNFTIGSRMLVDERAFRYARAAGVLIPDVGAKCIWDQAIAHRVVANTPALSTQITITTAAPDGLAGDGSFAANELEGGYIVIWPTVANHVINRRILANSLRAGAGAMVVTLDRPIPILTGAGATGECMASQYAHVLLDNDDAHSVVGVPMIAATNHQYVWLQTWGPIWCAPGGAGLLGIGGNRQAVFRHDGSVDIHDPADATVNMRQHAGYIISSAPGGGQGAPFIFLQIAP